MQHCIREEGRKNGESTKLLLKINFFNDLIISKKIFNKKGKNTQHESY